VPQILHYGGLVNGITYVIQPRRLPARAIAERVNYEMSLRDNFAYTLGSLVGYKTRTESVCLPSTKIVFVTDGIAANLLMAGKIGPNDFLIIDEAHERTLYMDLMMYLLKFYSKKVRCLIMSATIDTTKLKNYFNCPVVDVPGKMYNVSVVYEHVYTRGLSMAEPIANRVHEIHVSGKLGDILVFAPGDKEINDIIQSIKKKEKSLAGESTLHCYKLMASSPEEEQNKALAPAQPGIRKCIVATNVAETSLTIDGVVFVIDTGLVKETHYDLDLESDVLQVVPISKSRANQRKGRAGRTRPGVCYRMYDERCYNLMPDETKPAIQTSDLSELFLSCFNYGYNVFEIDWVDKPSQSSTDHFVHRLRDRGLVDVGGITNLGRDVVKLPCDIDYALFIISAVNYGCANLACLAVSCVDSDFMLNPTKSQLKALETIRNPRSEVLTWLNLLNEHGDGRNLMVSTRYGLREKSVRTIFSSSKRLQLEIHKMGLPYMLLGQNSSEGLLELLKNSPTLHHVYRGEDKSVRTSDGHLVRLTSQQPKIGNHFTCFKFLQVEHKLHMIGASAFV